MIEVRVPATSANMGTGFDSFGVALGLYNTISVKKIESGLVIRNFGKGNFSSGGENNLIYRAMKMVFDRVGYEPGGLSIYQRSSIPQTRGLGSSSACIIAGMTAANALSGKKLSYEEILELAAQMEGHPDNVAPALYGGFCVAVKTDSGVVLEKIKPSGNLRFVAMIPQYVVKTRESRRVLPEMISYKDAGHNIARASGLAVAMALGRYDNLKEYVDDRLHQPYRAAYIEGLYDIFEKGYELGAKALYLSGSGPTIMAMTNDDNHDFFVGMKDYFKREGMEYSINNLRLDNVGTVVKYIEE